MIEDKASLLIIKIKLKIIKDTIKTEIQDDFN